MGSGDENALADLYDRYGRLAFGLARRIMRNESLAEDAVQEGFLAAWHGAANFSPERGSARARLLTLVHRRAVDMVRQSVRRHESPTEMIPEKRLGTTDDTAADAALRDERRSVQVALSRLQPDERQLLELAYYGGLTQSELAARLDVPLGTIKSRTSTALRRLHAYLHEPEAQVGSSRRQEKRGAVAGVTPAIQDVAP
jgi:RNA polymerase sigma-70 factor, ECF subfamily